MDNLSIVIPVYNEEDAIIYTIEQIVEIMDQSNIHYELIIVNDGSSDKTGDILETSKLQFTLINHKRNRGYGASLKTGITQAKYEHIAITDADRTYPNEDIPRLFAELHNCDMVVGKRSFKKLPTITKPAKWFITKLASYLTRFKIPDLNSGLRMFRKKDAMQYFNIISNGFSFTSTITLAMLSNDLYVKYIPIEYMKREGKSKIKPIYDTMNFIQLIIKTVLYFNPLRVFIPLFFIFVLAAILVFTVSYYMLPKPLDVTSAVILFTGVQMLAIGMLADLIDKRIK
ncbi:glycosyltransferase family 2 protein [Salinivirga cyanobacteriivorans]